jgi:hypothetical protein
MNKLYPIKVWLATVLVTAPLLMVGATLIGQFGGLDIIGLFIVLGLFFSLPTLLVAALSFWLLIRYSTSALLAKVCFMLITVAGIWITLGIISGSMSRMLSVIYTASIIISGFVFRVRTKI